MFDSKESNNDAMAKATNQYYIVSVYLICICINKLIVEVKDNTKKRKQTLSITEKECPNG